jgi:hypothetical protein
LSGVGGGKEEERKRNKQGGRDSGKKLLCFPQAVGRQARDSQDPKAERQGRIAGGRQTELGERRREKRREREREREGRERERGPGWAGGQRRRVRPSAF